MRRLDNIQALRGIAALLVFAAHIELFEGMYRGDDGLLPGFLQAGVSGVDLFFLISGYVMVHVVADAARGKRACARFLFNRAVRIYPLYWIVSAGYLGLLVGGEVLFGDVMPPFDIGSSIFLYPYERGPLLQVGWTLKHELYFYAVFALLLLFRRQAMTPLLTAWAGLVFVGALFDWSSFNSWAGIILSPLTFEFLAGAAVAFAARAGWRKHAWPALIVGLVMYVLIAIVTPSAFFQEMWDAHLVRTLLFTAPFALILYAAVAMEKGGGRIAPLWLRRTGDASYSLYLTHIPVLAVVSRLVGLAGPAGVAGSAIMIAAGAVAGLGAAFLTYRYIERPLLRRTRKIGDRLIAFRVERDIPQEKSW